MRWLKFNLELNLLALKLQEIIKILDPEN